MVRAVSAVPQDSMLILSILGVPLSLIATAVMGLSTLVPALSPLTSNGLVGSWFEGLLLLPLGVIQFGAIGWAVGVCVEGARDMYRRSHIRIS